MLNQNNQANAEDQERSKQASFQTLNKAIADEDIEYLCEFLFQFKPTTKQQEIIQTIAYAKNKRVIINCMTRYGKSRCVSMAVLLYLLFNKNKKILLIAPTYDQTSILRNYMAEHITTCSTLFNLLEMEIIGPDKLKKEVSKKRLTFRNNCELIILSAEGTAERLMGFGGDMIIIDEGCLIHPEVYRTKISRMLGDHPDSILIEIGNPWHKNNQYFEHWISKEFKKIHVGYQTAIQEGRVTPEFIEEQKNLLTPIEFKILYESDFPEESEDSVFTYESIHAAINKWPNIHSTERILGVDVADKGRDLTVITTAEKTGANYKVTSIFSEAKSENTAVAGRIAKMREEHLISQVNIDCIGIGVGVVSMLQEQLRNISTVKINKCHFGQAAIDSTRFLNKKAEMYFRLKKMFEEGMISIPEHKELIKQLLSMKWEHTSNKKIRIIDPEDKSPDFADSLVYTIWQNSPRNYSIA